MDKYLEPDRPQMAIRRIPIAYWIPMATNTHSGYVVLIAFPLQQRVSRMRLTVTLYAPCLSCLLKVSHQFLGKGEFVCLSELSLSHRVVQIDKPDKCLAVFCNVCRSVQSKESLSCRVYEILQPRRHPLK